MKLILRVYSFLQSKTGFQSFGQGSVIKYPYKIWSKGNICIGSRVFVAENSFLSVSTEHRGRHYRPLLSIGDDTCIGSHCFIACIDRVVIEKEVLLSDRVFISDHIHAYRHLPTPILFQPLEPQGQVLIKSGSFIGINAVIMPGVTIGKNSVVGASSVVIKDVPDYCVAVGNPAKVIKRFDLSQQDWVSVKEN
jgi:acetyltransferase-like isoleucine patch superfamily enzyme